MPVALPKWLLPAVATFAVVGGGVGVASAVGGDEPLLDEPVPTTLVTTTTVAAPDDGAPEADDPADDPADDETSTDGVERYWGPECGDGEPTNHGHYVSSSEANGQSRSEAAHSPCGKPLQSVDVTTTTLAPPPEEGVDEGTETPTELLSPAAPVKGHGHGHGGGPSAGKAKGKGGSKHH